MNSEVTQSGNWDLNGKDEALVGDGLHPGFCRAPGSHGAFSDTACCCCFAGRTPSLQEPCPVAE